MVKSLVSWSRVFCVLVITAGLGLAACGSETVTVSPTTVAATTPAAATPSATTAPATTAAPTTAALTTVPAATTAAVTTSAATTAATTAAPITTAATTAPVSTTSAATTAGQTGTTAGKAAALLANIPGTADYLKEIKYNNYVALRNLTKIPADATFDSLIKDRETYTRFNNTLQNYDPAHVLNLDYLKIARTTAGFDLFQADYDAEAGQVPNYLSFAQGNFDYAAIDKAWPAGGAVKGAIGSYSSYTLEKLDPTQELNRMYLGPLSLVAVPDQKLLLLSKPPTAGVTAAATLPNKSPLSSNPQVKALLDAFGDAMSIHMGTNLISAGDPTRALTPGAIRATVVAAEPVPVPSLVGYAYYDDGAGTRSYLVANYYANETNAKAAQPILEDRLKTGTSLRTRDAYSKYWDVVSSEVKGNLLLIKLNMKQTYALSQFIYARDFPAFNV